MPPNPRNVERERSFTRRAAILGIGKLGLMGSLAARLYYLQVVEGQRYHTLAEENRISLRLLPPPRGRIFDRYNEPLAVTRLNYRVVIRAEQAREVERVLDQLGKLIEVTENDKRRVLRDVRRHRGFIPIMVREELSWEDVARIEVNAPDLPGVAIEIGQSRHYPHTEAIGHILGYVGPAAEKDLDGDPLLELPDFKVGKNGIEKIYDVDLRGVAGSQQVEVNAVGRVVRELGRSDGEPGKDIVLTLDIVMQEYIRQRLGAESASAVVMDVTNGELIAMVSAPGYDPNIFSSGISAREWNELLHNPLTPLSNKSIAGTYAPGSTFKMVTAMAALEAGVLNWRQSISCHGYVELGEHRFHCWKKDGHGAVDLADALTVSCDVYFYEAARRVGIDRLGAMARRLGFDQKLGIDLPGERSALIPTRDWKERRFKKQWLQGETLIAGIGQGYVTTTPLQLATMTARLVNGGIAVLPHLTRSIGGKPTGRNLPPYPSLGLSPQNLQAMVRAMSSVVNSERGTAYKARITEAGMDMGGKTGTAQVRRISMQERERGVKRNDELPWAMRDHALFVGFAPVNTPRYACAVVVEHGGGGSAVAAPICHDILLEVQRRDRQMRNRPGGRVALIDVTPSRPRVD